MPHEGSLFAELNALGFTPAAIVVEAQLDLGCMFRIQREVDPGSIPSSTQGVGFTRQTATFHLSSQIQLNLDAETGLRIAYFGKQEM